MEDGEKAADIVVSELGLGTVASTGIDAMTGDHDHSCRLSRQADHRSSSSACLRGSL